MFLLEKPFAGADDLGPGKGLETRTFTAE